MKDIIDLKSIKSSAANFCQSIDFCCRFLPSAEKGAADFCQWHLNSLKMLTNKVCTPKTPLKPSQTSIFKGQTAAAGGNGNHCGLCISIFSPSPVISAIGPIKATGRTNALRSRHGEKGLFWAAQAWPLIILQAAAVGSCLLLAQPSYGEGWGRAGSDKWSTAGRSPMRMTVNAPVSGKTGGWTTLNRFDRPKTPVAAAAPKVTLAPPPMGSGIEGLRKLIRFVESRRDGYDAIHHSAKRRPNKKPTEMTIGEILAWIDATPGQHHAIGLYQIIPTTLKRLIAKTGLSATTKFTPKVQDHLGDVLILEAGYREFDAGRVSLSKFMDELGKIWAGLPMANGRSAYHGKAGNHATITRAQFDAQMRQIFQLKTTANSAL